MAAAEEMAAAAADVRFIRATLDPAVAVAVAAVAVPTAAVVTVAVLTVVAVAATAAVVVTTMISRKS